MSKYYGCTVTQKGRALIAKLLATKTLAISRVMVGSGTPDEGTSPDTLEDLVEPIAAGTSTVPTYDGDTVHMTVEYRSDLNGGLENGFWLSEFAVYAIDPDDGEIMLYYGTLGDYPQWVSAYSSSGIDTRRYPISITVGEDATVIIDYSAEAFMTAEDVADYCTTTMLPQFLVQSQAQISTHDASTAAHPYIQSVISGMDSRLSLLELMYNTDVSKNPFTVTFESLDGLTVAGVWNADQGRIEF